MEITYPKWEDIGLPSSFGELLVKTADRQLLNFFTETRIFHQEIRAGVQYTCGMCGYRKNFDKVFEEFTECPKCGATILHASLHWRTARDTIKITQPLDGYARRVIEAMAGNYQAYFSAPVDLENFCTIKFRGDGFFTDFKGGSSVHWQCPVVSVMKAALCCPYLWDTGYDWHILSFGRNPGMRLTHLLYQLVLENERYK